MFANRPGNLPVSSSLFKFALSTERMYCKANKHGVQETLLKDALHGPMRNTTLSKQPCQNQGSRNPLPAHGILSKSMSPRLSITHSYKRLQRPLMLCEASSRWQHDTSTWFFFP